MKVLLTGHKGFIGQHLHQALLNNNHQVTTYEWEDGKLDYDEVVKQDYVLHIGAISSTTERDVEKVLEQNYDFSTELINICSYHGIPLQFSSSASIYGLESTFREDTIADPRSPYAWSKYLTERYIKYTYRRHGRYQVFRYFNVFSTDGASESHKEDQASPYFKFTKQAKEKGKITIFEGSDRVQRDFIHVECIVNYHLKFMQLPMYGVFNLGSGKTKTFKEVALEVARQHNATIETVPMPEHIARQYQWYTKADMTKTSKALACLNYPKVSLQEVQEV